MAGPGDSFPYYLKVYYDESGGIGFPAFQAAGTEAFNQIQRQAERFKASTRDIGDALKRALTGATQTGTLDLGVGDLQQQAAMLTARAEAARRVAAATEAAARSEAGFNLEARNTVAQVRLIAAQEEAAAASARDLAAAMSLVQNELQRTNGTQVAMSGVMNNGTNTVRAQRFAYVQLGQQLQDVAIQAQLGVNPLVILVQQGSQAAFALSGLGGAVGRVATFLAGPWGAAIFGAAAVLGMFIASMREGKQASESLGDGMDFQRRSVNELISAIEELEKAQQKQIRSSYAAEQASLRDAAAALQAANSKREQAIATLQAVNALQQEGAFRGIGVPGGDPTAAVAAVKGSMEGQIAALRDAQVKGMKLVSAAMVPVIQRQSEAAADPRKAIGLRYDELEDRLQRTYLNDAQKNPAAALKTYQDGLTKLTAARERDLDALKKTGNESERAARAAARLAERGDDAAKKISNITDRFADLPPQVVQVNRAMRELDDLADDFASKPPPNYAAIQEALKKARETVSGASNQPFRDFLEDARETEAIDKLIRSGKEGQADALQRILALSRQQGPLSERELQTVLETVQAERERGKEIDRLQHKQQAYLSAISGVQSAFQSGIAGILTGRGGDFGQALEDQVANLFATRLSDRLFGGIFSALEDAVTGGADDVSQAGDYLTNVLRDLGVEIEAVKDQIAGNAPGTSTFNAAANDNGATGNDILVTGRRLARLDPITALGNTLTRTFEKEFSGISKFFKDHADAAGVGLLSGQIAFGQSNSKVGSLLGGAMGEKVGEKLAGSTFGKSLGKIGEFLGPLGSIAGGLLGGVIGSLFAGPKPSASAVVTSVSGAASVTGNNKEQQQAVTGLSVNLQSSLQKIIEQLGGTAGAFDVSIGKREDYYRVAGTNTTAVGDKHPERGGVSLLYNGTDANEALRIAVLEAFRDGAVQGIRAGTKSLLTNNDDIEIGVAKAIKFEQVFKDLKRYTDPVGAALDAVNLKFRQLVDIFKEAGASAEEMKALEDLYGRERAEAIKQVTEQLTSSLKSFLSSLTTGDSGLSLRTRLAYSNAETDPLAARVAANDSSAYDPYVQAEQTRLDIMRQIYGSGEEYFAALDQAIALTKGAILTEQGRINAANDAGTPFDTTPIVSATQQQTDTLVAALQPQLNSIAASNAAIADAIRNGTFGLTRAQYQADLAKAANF